MPGMRDNIKSWWSKQKEEFNLQRVLASRDSAVRKHAKLYKAEMAKTERQVKAKGECDPYDLIMEKYARRMDISDNPEKYSAIDKQNAKAGKQHGNATGCSSILSDLYGEQNMNNIGKNDMKGRGLGAWLGRLVTGRRDSGVRATGMAAFDTHTKETGFNDGERRAVWKLQQKENEIRSGTMTVEEVLKLDAEDFDKKYDALETITKLKNQSLESRNQPATMESAETVEKFRVLARDRARELDEIHERHCMDFFPQHYVNGVLDTQKVNAQMYPQHTNNAKNLDRINTRATLAQAYMYSQGDTLEQIYGDTKECKDLRTKRGKEMMEKLTGSKEEAGKFYADIAKKLADFPTPDMSSDAAIYNNMREIHFMSNTGINLTQIINLRDESRDVVRQQHDLEIAFHKNISPQECTRFNNMTQNSQSLMFNGIEARISRMTAGQYSLTPELHADKKYQQSSMKQILTVFGAERQGYITENLVPGKKSGDNKPILRESALANDKKLNELAGTKPEVIEKNITDTITNEQVRQIQKQVLSAKPKVKTDESSRKPYSKEELFENKKNNVKKRESVNENDKNIERKKSETSPKKREQFK
jgi:hypothetical protein